MCTFYMHVWITMQFSGAYFYSMKNVDGSLWLMIIIAKRSEFLKRDLFRKRRIIRYWTVVIKIKWKTRLVKWAKLMSRLLRRQISQWMKRPASPIHQYGALYWHLYLFSMPHLSCNITSTYQYINISHTNLFELAFLYATSTLLPRTCNLFEHFLQTYSNTAYSFIQYDQFINSFHTNMGTYSYVLDFVSTGNDTTHTYSCTLSFSYTHTYICIHIHMHLQMHTYVHIYTYLR